LQIPVIGFGGEPKGQGSKWAMLTRHLDNLCHAQVFCEVHTLEEALRQREDTMLIRRIFPTQIRGWKAFASAGAILVMLSVLGACGVGQNGQTSDKPGATGGPQTPEAQKTGDQSSRPTVNVGYEKTSDAGINSERQDLANYYLGHIENMIGNGQQAGNAADKKLESIFLLGSKKKPSVIRQDQAIFRVKLRDGQSADFRVPDQIKIDENATDYLNNESQKLQTDNRTVIVGVPPVNGSIFKKVTSYGAGENVHVPEGSTFAIIFAPVPAETDQQASPEPTDQNYKKLYDKTGSVLIDHNREEIIDYYSYKLKNMMNMDESTADTKIKSMKYMYINDYYPYDSGSAAFEVQFREGEGTDFVVPDAISVNDPGVPTIIWKESQDYKTDYREAHVYTPIDEQQPLSPENAYAAGDTVHIPDGGMYEVVFTPLGSTN
jgi:hypothetical protein